MQLTGILAAASLATSACTTAGSGPTTSPPDTAQLKLTPSGDAGAWFAPDYGRGIASSYSTANTVCAIGTDSIIETTVTRTGKPRIFSRPLAPSQTSQNWELEDASCSERSGVSGQREPVVLAKVDGATWALVDSATGQVSTRLELPKNTALATPVFGSDRRLIVTTGTALHAFTLDGTTATPSWQYPLPPRSEVTMLGDQAVGIKQLFADRLFVIDASTGDSRYSATVKDVHWITWATDGYIQKIQETDPEYAYFDLDGKEVDRTLKLSQYRFVPGPDDGVTFPVKDHRAAGRVVGVDASGRPALFQDERQRDFTQSGEVKNLPDSIIMLQGVSQDGGLLLFGSSGSSGHGVVIVDGTGNEVTHWDVPYSTLWIESGHIVLKGDSGTSVLRAATA